MENTNNKGWWLAGIVLVLLVLVAGGTYLYDKFGMSPEDGKTQEEQNSDLASNCGLTIENVKPGDEVSFPLTLTGTVNNPEGADCTWIMFEGQAGVATLHYQTKDGWSLPVDTEPVPVAEWMSTSTTFSVTLDFDNSVEQLPSGFDFKVIITEDNPSGEGTPDTVELPLVLE